MDPIQQRLNQACSEYVFSGYQLYGECQGKNVHLWGGNTSYWPGAAPVASGTYFDIGSITKVVVTTSLLALEVDAGKLKIEQPVSDFVTELKTSKIGSIKVEELLNHCSGLTWWYPLYEKIGEQKILSWLLEHSDELVKEAPRKKAVYSDPDFWLLGLVAEKLCGPLKDAFLTRIANPLKMTETIYGPVENHQYVAATEYSLVRSRLLWGEVFDDNAHALGGECPHAGLFSTARGLGKFCQAWMDALQGKSDWLSRDVASAFTKRTKIVEGSDWGLGWDTKSESGSSCGKHFSSDSFGHLGYPGGSLWIDPERASYLVFLSNRVHPSRYDERIRQLRPEIHDLVATSWEGEAGAK